MFFHLGFNFGESRFRAGGNVRSHACGVEGPRGEGEIQRKAEFGFARNFFHGAMEQHGIRFVMLEQTIQFVDVALEIIFNRFAIFRCYVTVGYFHRAPGFCRI
jgi:hypothetical protein